MSNYWIALSGGLDSHVLLHFLITQFPQFPLTAVHINHQLLPEAAGWEKHCQQLCKSLQVPLKIIRVQIQKKPGDSLEANARDARYAALAKLIKKNDVLFTAHHLDDQAETLLLQLLRGAGLRGVAAMPQNSNFHLGFLVRPLLAFSRDELLVYATYYRLRWIDDPSNLDQRFDRNFIRQTLTPLFKKRWPQFAKTLARFAKHCAEQEKLLQQIAAEDYQQYHGKHLNTLSISAAKKLEQTRLFNLLRYFFASQHLSAPPEILLLEIQRTLFQAKSDANPMIKWNNVAFRRYKNDLYVCPMKSPSSTASLTAEELGWCKNNLSYNLTDPKLTITYRQGGERFKPAGSKHNRTLKNLFQEWRIPPWQRDYIPLIYYNNHLIAIVGYTKGTLYEPFDD